MFSTVFPSYHYRVGESTYFVEKIRTGIQDDYFFELPNGTIALPKFHTIRAGKRFEVGEKLEGVTASIGDGVSDFTSKLGDLPAPSIADVGSTISDSVGLS